MDNRKRTDGYVYLVRSGNDLYKIGRTLNLDQRMSALFVDYKDIAGERALIHSFYTLYADLWEKFFHEFFDSCRYQSRYKEWFYLEECEVNLFKCFQTMINFKPDDSRFTIFVPYDTFEWFYQSRFVFFSKKNRRQIPFKDVFIVHFYGCIFKEPYRQSNPYEIDVRHIYEVDYESLATPQEQA